MRDHMITPTEKTLTDLGEDELVRRLTAHLPVDPAQVELGAGDDCALLPATDPAEWLLFKTDCLVENVHFTRETAPEAVGRKAIARTVSDFAAMAGWPESFLVTAAFPQDLEIAYADGLFAGIGRAAEEFAISAAGGETSASPGGIVLSIAMLGRVERTRVLLRSGGRPGDKVFVTGKLGNTLATGRHLRFVPRLKEAAWLSENFEIHAMMDLSDGVAADLPRLAQAGGTGWHLEPEALPCREGASIENALNDGEDYELLFALPARQAEELQAQWPKHFELELTEIGRLTDPGSDDDDERTHPTHGGYDHFRKS